MNRNTAKTVWDKATRYLRERLHPDVYSRWIEVIRPVSLSDQTLRLGVDNDFYQTWLEENYMALIRDAVAAAADQPLTISFVVQPRAAPAAPAVPEPPRKKIVRERGSPAAIPPQTLNPRFTFESFIVGPSNSFAHAASLAVSQAPGKAYNPLFIYGGVGLGKTHLMQAIGHHVLATVKLNVCYLSSEALLNEYIDALTNRTLIQFRKKYRNTDLLLVDDIHFLAGKERLQEEFFHTFNALFDAHKQIVMTSDRPASEIIGLEKRLVSRFEWGLVTELEPPDLETRIAILRHKLTQMNSTLGDEQLLFIAHNIKSNVRRLEGALIRVLSYSSLTNQQLTIEGLRHLLRDTLEEEASQNLTFDLIQRAVAEHYDVRLADMTSKRRYPSVAVPRQVAMYLCRSLTRASFPEIANAFGKTHATVLHAYRTIKGRMDVDSSLKHDVEEITHKLTHRG